MVPAYHIIGTISNNLPLKILYNYKPYETYFQYKNQKGVVQVSTFNTKDIKKLNAAYETNGDYLLKDFYEMLPHLSKGTVKRALATLVKGGFKDYL